MQVFLSTHGVLNKSYKDWVAEQSKQIRLILVVDRQTGLPLYFRYDPGNIVDVSTLRTIYHITVLSTSDSKRDEAMLFGADRFVCTKEKNAFSDLTETFDLMFCTAHGNIKWEYLFESMKNVGK